MHEEKPVAELCGRVFAADLGPVDGFGRTSAGEQFVNLHHRHSRITVHFEHAMTTGHTRSWLAVSSGCPGSSQRFQPAGLDRIDAMNQPVTVHLSKPHPQYLNDGIGFSSHFGQGRQVRRGCLPLLIDGHLDIEELDLDTLKGCSSGRDRFNQLLTSVDGPPLNSAGVETDHNIPGEEPGEFVGASDFDQRMLVVPERCRPGDGGQQLANLRLVTGKENPPGPETGGSHNHDQRAADEDSFQNTTFPMMISIVTVPKSELRRLSPTTKYSSSSRSILASSQGR